MLLNTIRKYKIHFLVIIFLLGFISLTWLNFQFAQGNPGGYDFYKHWYGTRQFFVDGTNPYGPENRLAMQNSVYGRAAVEGEDQLYFSIPLFGMLLYSPFALISNFILARALWMTFLEFSLAGILYLSIKLAWWKINRALLYPLLIFTFFGFHSLLPLLEGRLIIPITLMALGALHALRKKQDELAGLLLALVLISPIPLSLFVVFLVIRFILTKRTTVIWWLLGCTGLLIGFSIVLIPNWMLQYVVTLINAYLAIDPGSPGGVLISRWGEVGNRLSILISVVAGILVVFEWFRGVMADEKRVLWTAMITLALGTWSGIRVSPMDYIVLLPAIIFGFELFDRRWKRRSAGIILSILATLFVIDWFIYFSTMSTDLKPGISSFLLIPFPVAVIIILYWNKWWVQKSTSIDSEPAKLDIYRP